MGHLCARCARVALQNGRPSSHFASAQNVRSFSSSSRPMEKDPVDMSAKHSPASEPPKDPPRSRFSLLMEQAVQNAARNSKSQQPSRPQGQVLRRTIPLRTPSSNSDAQRPRQPFVPRQPGTAPPGNLLLRRTGPPRTEGSNPSQSQFQRTPGSRPPQRGNKNNSPTPGQRQAATNRRRRGSNTSLNDNENNLADAGLESTINDYVNAVVDPPHNPTESLPYTPITLTETDLRADWPNTPLSSAGLTESVVQRIEWLARRLPHGWQSPEQLAERFHAGELVRFESAEEKETVLALAAELANKRAGMLTERKGETVPSHDMGLEDLSARKSERDALVQSMVKGLYPVPEKQQMPFMDGIARQLGNNETYGTVDVQKFLAKIESLVPAGSVGGAGAPSGKKRAQKNV